MLEIDGFEEKCRNRTKKRGKLRRKTTSKQLKTWWRMLKKEIRGLDNI